MQSLWMIVASFAFAVMGVCVKLASSAFSAAEIVFYRSAISLVFMLGLVCFRHISLATPHWKFQLQRSVSGFLSLWCYFNAISMLPLATAVTFSYTSPLFLAVALAGFGKIRPRASVFGALALGFVGVVLLLRPTFHADQLVGGLFGIATGLLSAMAFYNVRELGELGESEDRTVFYFTAFATVASAFWMLLYEFHPVDLRGGLELVGVGASATVAQLAMTRAYKRGEDARGGESCLYHRRFRLPVRHVPVGREPVAFGVDRDCPDRDQRGVYDAVFARQSGRTGLSFHCGPERLTGFGTAMLHWG